MALQELPSIFWMSDGLGHHWKATVTMTRCPHCGQLFRGPVLNRLRQARLAAGLKQSEVGQRLEPPRSHAAVSDIERGHTELTLNLLRQWARITGVSITSLIAEEHDQP